MARLADTPALKAEVLKAEVLKVADTVALARLSTCGSRLRLRAPTAIRMAAGAAIPATVDERRTMAADGLPARVVDERLALAAGVTRRRAATAVVEADLRTVAVVARTEAAEDAAAIGKRYSGASP